MSGRHCRSLRDKVVVRARKSASVVLLVVMCSLNLCAGVMAGCTSTGGVKHTPPTVEIHH